MLICLIGTGSTGKSTLCRELSKVLNIPYYPTPTRKVPPELRCKDAGQREVMKNYYEMFEAIEGDAICDRSMFDVMAYSKAYGAWTKEYIQKEIEEYIDSFVYPDYIFYLPIEFALEMDGEREIFEAKRVDVDDAIKEIMECSGVYYDTITGTVQQRVRRILDIISWHEGA